MEPVFIGLLFVTALGTNALLGIWRSGLRRFSPAWFVAIHASIPLLIAMRLVLIRTLWVIPPEIGLAFVGQFVGARLPSLRRPGPGARPIDVDNA
jgi:hypothetical protein